MRHLIIYILIIITAPAFSQTVSLDSAEVKSSTVEFNGGKYSGYLIELNAPPDIVEETIRERFKLQGVKPKETKDFLVYRNVIIPSIDPSAPVDAFVKIERKSKKEKDQSNVYFIASAPGEIPEDKAKSSDGVKTMAVATGGAFLTAMLPHVKTGVHNKNLADQQSIVKKEEKKLADLTEEQQDLKKKLTKLQSDIEYNAKAQERQAAEVEKAKGILNALTGKTAASN